MPSLLRLPAYADKGIIHVVIESPRAATSKLKFEPVAPGFAQAGFSSGVPSQAP